MVEVLTVKYLNNIVEQSNRKIKGKMHQCLGSKSWVGAEATLAGVELCSMLNQGQMIDSEDNAVWEEFEFATEPNNIGTMIINVENINKGSVEHVAELYLLTPQIANAKALGIRSLQFENLTYQALNSLKYNVESIRAVNKELELFGVNPEQCRASQLEELKEKCLHILTQTKLQNGNRSVFQDSMDEGDSELF
jgi:hypothetical protein